MAAYVYILQKGNEDVCKIGKGSPASRATYWREHTGWHEIRITEVFEFETDAEAYRVESLAHRDLRKHRYKIENKNIGIEWFAVNPATACRSVMSCALSNDKIPVGFETEQYLEPPVAKSWQLEKERYLADHVSELELRHFLLLQCQMVGVHVETALAHDPKRAYFPNMIQHGLDFISSHVKSDNVAALYAIYEANAQFPVSQVVFLRFLKEVLTDYFANGITHEFSMRWFGSDNEVYACPSTYWEQLEFGPFPIGNVASGKPVEAPEDLASAFRARQRKADD